MLLSGHYADITAKCSASSTWFRGIDGEEPVRVLRPHQAQVLPGFTDHVFALMHPLGFRFAPRIRDLSDTKLYLPNGKVKYQALAPMTGGTINVKAIRTHWNEILRLATSIKQGTVTASLMLRKLGSYPRQNGLAVALRELGRIEQTLFILS